MTRRIGDCCGSVQRGDILPKLSPNGGCLYKRDAEAERLPAPISLLKIHKMLFEALTWAFRVPRSTPRRGRFNNMRPTVDRIGVGKARLGNARFAAFVRHYLFEPDSCNPASG
jgi:hypothetical protein